MKIGIYSMTSLEDYAVSYDVEIIGTIYDNNISRKEKSAVSEIVKVDSNGKVKLTKTMNGSWYFVQ
jgi:hypothetical protein